MSVYMFMRTQSACVVAVTFQQAVLLIRDKKSGFCCICSNSAAEHVVVDLMLDRMSLFCMSSFMLHCTSAPEQQCQLCLLQVDKPWEEVYKSLPEPLYRHQYGT